MKLFDRYEDPRRRTLIRALAGGAFMLGMPGAAAFAAELLGKRPAQMPEGQSIYRMSGTVTVNGAPATLQTLIGNKDTIETGKNSEVVFAAGENAFLLRAESRMTLEPVDKRPALASALTLFQGKLLSVFPPGKAQTQIRTTISTAGIRGTGAYIEADPDRTYFCTCYGVVDLKSNADPESTDTVAARHHDKPVYILAQADRGNAIRPGPFLNHNDQELMLVETLVGRETPFVFPKEAYRAPRRDY